MLPVEVIGSPDELSEVKYILSPLELYLPNEEQELKRASPLKINIVREKKIVILKRVDLLIIYSFYIVTFIIVSLRY